MNLSAILAVGTATAERSLSPSDLAELQGARVADVERTLGPLQLRVSDRSPGELALEAARSCLERAGVVAAELDVILWSSSYKRRAGICDALEIQHALGATQAFAFDSGANCSELVMALQIARGLQAADPGLRRILIVTGEQWSEAIPTRTLSAIGAKNSPCVFSDGGAAALIEQGERCQLIGFGSGTDGRYWDIARRSSEHRDGAIRERLLVAESPTALQQTLAFIPIYRLALTRCLDASGLTLAEIDHIIFPMAGEANLFLFARWLDLPRERLLDFGGASSHIGAADLLFALDSLLRSDKAKPGQHVLLGAFTFGILRFAVVRL